MSQLPSSYSRSTVITFAYPTAVITNSTATSAVAIITSTRTVTVVATTLEEVLVMWKRRSANVSYEEINTTHNIHS